MIKILLFILSCLIVSFGTPSSIPALGPLSALMGYALFFLSVIDETNLKKKFFIALNWFAIVTMIQYGWVLSHPFYYIYFIYALGPWIVGAQFGLITLLVSKKRLDTLLGPLMIASVWVFLEWFRLFWLMGLSFNISGMALASTLYSLQSASLGGAYFLSFWVMLTNLLFLKICLNFNKKALTLCFLVAIAPYAFGFFHVSYHDNFTAPSFKALLVQPAFEAEESKGFQNMPLEEKIAFVLNEWEEIAHLVRTGLSDKADLIVLPESVVPFASTSCLFPEKYACGLLEKTFSKKMGKSWKIPFLKTYQFESRPCNYACNGYMAQGIAIQTDTPVLIGMEYIDKDKLFYSSALLFSKEGESYRYDKQVLVPMAEYIPFKWLQEAAKSYGISGSFTHGDGAKLFTLNGIKCGVSICYEETIGSVVRENKTEGGHLLINITNDGWYPNSELPQQHLDLARLRTVELGMPLLRSCNTGVTCAVDSLGRVIKTLGANSSEQQTLKGSLFVTLPVYNYETLYSKTGNALILGLSLFFILAYLMSQRWKRV